MSYYIDINRTSSSTRITKAYDLHYIGLGYTISQNYWDSNSTSAAFEGVATIYGGWLNLNIFLKSIVSEDTLNIKVRA